MKYTWEIHIGKKLLFYFFFLLLLVSVTFLALEATTRILALAPLPTKYKVKNEKDSLPWIYEPNSHFKGVSAQKEFLIDHKHNSLGFRDTEHSIKKPKNVFRILGLGDSFTYGVGALFHETYLYQVEKKLNQILEGNPKVEILKMGVERYWPEPERLVLEHIGLKYKPDLVMVGFVPNDVHDTAKGIDGLNVRDGYLVEHRKNRIPKFIFPLAKYSHFVRFSMRKINQFREGKNRKLTWIGHYSHKIEWHVIKSEYQKMVDLSNSIGAKFMVVNIPQWSEIDFVEKELEGFLKKTNTLWADVHHDYYQYKDPHKRFNHQIDGHFNPKGYELTANTIIRTLAKAKIIPNLTVQKLGLHKDLAQNPPIK